MTSATSELRNAVQARPLDEAACRRLAMQATNGIVDPASAAKAVDEFSFALAGLAIGETFNTTEEERGYLLSFVLEAIDAIEELRQRTFH